MKNTLTTVETQIDKSGGSTYSWIKNVPPSDNNFKNELKKADAETIKAVLDDLPAENNISRRKALETRLRKLEKNHAATGTPTDEKREIARQWFFKNYFGSDEIENAKKSNNPAEYLRKNAVESQRGGSGSGEIRGYTTQSKGNVHLWLEPDKMSGEPSVIFDLRQITRQLAETFADPEESPTEKQIRYHREAVKEAQKREAEKNLKSPIVTEAEVIFADTVVPINVADIAPSPFEPQSRRRARFKDEEIESLGNSIRQHGLAQPILVRRRGTGSEYEIVFGERRFLAVKNINVKTINCFVRVLTDAQVLELQYEENHRRQENDPLDDAFFFRFLREKENYSIEELASRLNTTAANVQNKLVLGDLIIDAQKELSDGLLPLKHAYFLARFPEETQKLIVREQYAYRYCDREMRATSYKSFVEEVEENITRKLENAPFSTIDQRLRLDGLICPDCPDRTGFAPSLFNDLTKGDSCLNKSCFEQKTNVQLRLKRDELALQLPNSEQLPIEEKVKEVPLVTDKVWTDKVLGEKPLTNQKFLDEPECEFSEISLIVEGARKGQETYICREKSCAIHFEQAAPPDLLDADFVRRVEQLTREKVLAKSLDAFSDYKPIWMYDDLVQKLIFELWLRSGIETQKTTVSILQEWKNFPKDYKNLDRIKEFIAALDKTQQSRLIFLLIFQTEGLHLDGNQDGIKKLSLDYARTDYRILEAEARLELAPESEKDLARDILTVTRGGVNDLRKPDFDLDAVH